MKLTLLIFWLAVFSMQANFSNGQNPSISLKAENTTVEKVIDYVEGNSNYKFVYDLSDVDLNRIVNIEVRKASIETLLNKLFKGTKTAYKIIDEQIILKSKTDKVNSHSAEQEFISIAGKVTDQEGVPLVGVTVMTEDSKYGSMTNWDGNFSLRVPESEAAIVFNYLGFTPRKLALAEIPDLLDVQVALEEQVNALDEVVITGYQTIAKERSTGSFGQVETSFIENRPNAVNIIERIEGSVAGLNYSNGEITIRGGSSIELSNEPLIVVDGFAVEGGTQSINPEDVESINVLKDASAASIWGVRASNGVIVITTKKGKSNQQLNINASVFTSITDKVDYNDNDWLSPAQQLEMRQEYDAKNWTDYGSITMNPGALSLYEQAQVYRQGYAPDGNTWSEPQYQEYLTMLSKLDASEQWEQYLLRSPILNTYNISASAGGDKNTAYASLVYNNNRSGAKGTSNNRLIFNIRDNFKMNEKFELSTGIVVNYSENINNGINPESFQSTNAYEMIVDDYGKENQYYKAYNPWVSREREALTGISHTYNPLDAIRYNDNTSDNLLVRATVGAKYDIIKDLQLSSSFQYEKGNGSADVFQSMDNYEQRLRIANFYVPDESTGDYEFQLPLGTRYQYTRNELASWNFRNTLTFDKNWNRHNLNVFGGMEMRRYFFESISERKFGYNKQTTNFIPINEEDVFSYQLRDWQGRSLFEDSFNLDNRDDREFSVFANASYEFDDRFAVNGSFRIDQKNLFGSDPAFRYKPLWSAGLAWNIGNEAFLAGVDWVNRLRLRSTIGVNGNAGQSSPYAQATNVLSSWGQYPVDYLVLTNPANDQLKWEETRVVNLGLDFDLFKGKFGGILDFYHKNSTDLLGYRTLDITNGVAGALVNYASMTNKGVELTLNSTILQSGKFNWRLSANIAYNKNEVTEIAEQNQTAAQMVLQGKLAVGEPLNNLYSYNYAGLDNAGRIMLNNTDGSTKLWKDENGSLTVIEPEELINHGSTVAPWFGGLSNTVDFNGLSLTANLTYKFGHVSYVNYGSSRDGYSSRVHQIWQDRWRQPGDELTTRVPKISYNGVNPYSGQSENILDYGTSDQYFIYSQDNVIDAGFIRVRDLILAYELPQRFLSPVFFNRLSFSAQVTNPFLWTVNDRGVDPEAIINSQFVRGVNNTAYQNLKTYTFGLRASF